MVILGGVEGLGALMFRIMEKQIEPMVPGIVRGEL